MDWIHHARTTILLFASAEVVLLAVIALGAVPWNLSRRLGAYMAPSIFQFFGIGAVLLAVPTWYGFHAGVPTRGVFATLVAAAVLAAGWALLRLLRERDLPARTRAIRRLRLHARDFAILSFFAACVSLWMGLLIRNGDLPLISKLNHDIFAYAVHADDLLRYPDVFERVGGFSLIGFLHTDVFGTFTFLAFSAFLLMALPIDVIQAPMVASCAMAAGAVYWICRSQLRLPVSLSVILGTVLLVNPLLQYSVIEYFLAQSLSSAMLLITIGTVLGSVSAYGAGVRWPHIFIAGMLIGAGRYIYPVAVTFHVFSASVVATLLLTFGLWLRPAARPSGSARPVRTFVVNMLLIVAVMALGIMAVAPDAPGVIHEKFVTYAKENVAGWPLPFIGALSFLSLPSTFTAPGLTTAKALELIAMIGLAAAALLFTFRSSGRCRAAYNALTILFGLYVLLYIIVYSKYGSSYQQWKFASSYPILISFIVLAGLTLPFKTKSGRFYYGAILSFMTLISINNIVLLTKWRNGIMRLPTEMSALRGIDVVPGVDMVFVDLPRPNERMIALSYIRQKHVRFSGLTNWGPGDTLNSAGGHNLAVLRRGLPDCNETRLGQFGSFHLVKADGGLRIGEKVSFARSVPSCVQATGLNHPEPWGVWSTAGSVSLAFDCDCGASAGPLEVLLTVRPFLAPPALTRQQVLISVDGSAPVGHELSTPDNVTLALPIPPGENRRVRIAIQLPDAIAPSKLGISGDPRQLAIGLISLELRRP